MNKEKILKESFDLINEVGLEAFSMRKLADRLKCKPASIYYYYPTKNEIMNELFYQKFMMFFDDEDVDCSNIKDHLTTLCHKVLKNRDEYLFIIKYNRCNFLDNENVKCMNLKTQKKREQIKKFFEDTKFSEVDHILIMGPVKELAFANKNLNGEQVNDLVNGIIKSLERSK